MSPKAKQQQESTAYKKTTTAYHSAPVPSTNCFSGLLFFGGGHFLPTASPYLLHSPLLLQPTKENNDCIAIRKNLQKDTSPQFS